MDYNYVNTSAVGGPIPLQYATDRTETTNTPIADNKNDFVLTTDEDSIVVQNIMSFGNLRFLSGLNENKKAFE